MKKERVFYLDFIRAVAAISIIITHYNARFLYMDPVPYKKMIITSEIGGVYIGAWGVSLFFIISGAALMYVYQDAIDLKVFYKKRFLNIYPMFWLAYFVALLLLFVLNRGIVFPDVPKYRFLFTLIGIDGWLSQIMGTFYILGEWFLGVIIMLYIFFPLLRKGLIKAPKVTALFAFTLYIGLIFFFGNGIKGIALDTIILSRVPEILFGMWFIKERRKVSISAALIGLAIVVANSFLKPSTIPQMYQITYVGISSYIVLIYVASIVERFRIVDWFVSLISKYSYAIFLVHHVIIEKIRSRFDLAALSAFKSYILFLAICLFIAIFSGLLYKAHDVMMKIIKDNFLQRSKTV
ncbi:acyltransferase family protein [Ohessyouella blattaphilus]|uniref:Acyltransferase n=2 Tax=Bacteria TaxID=2 RepID=A0ABT1EHI8_9FIRM|nr:acyltransferase [Ohessyouella blattaphilus]MCP1110128.1 acyltransferase [Ohessyouella blattaphilus]MCR8563522.1 acyltransferase [Ohessyouella blattaphilus]